MTFDSVNAVLVFTLHVMPVRRVNVL